MKPLAYTRSKLDDVYSLMRYGRSKIHASSEKLTNDYSEKDCQIFYRESVTHARGRQKRLPSDGRLGGLSRGAAENFPVQPPLEPAGRW